MPVLILACCAASRKQKGEFMNIDHLASLWVSSWFGIELPAQIDVPSFCCHTEERKPVSAASVEHRTATGGPEKRIFMIHVCS